MSLPYNAKKKGCLCPLQTHKIEDMKEYGLEPFCRFDPLAAMTSQDIAKEILKMNTETAAYGLSLTSAEALELAETRRKALLDSGRVEFGTGAVIRLIDAFCDSQYITPDTYAETLNALLEYFYYLKSETRDKVSDETLICLLKERFENEYHGSIEWMQGCEFRYQKDYGNLPEGYNEEYCDDDTSMRDSYEAYEWEEGNS